MYAFVYRYRLYRVLKKLLHECVVSLIVDIAIVPTHVYSVQFTKSLQVSSVGSSLPRYPEYATQQGRVDSFSGRLVFNGQSADAMAKAGFFCFGQ